MGPAKTATITPATSRRSSGPGHAGLIGTVMMGAAVVSGQPAPKQPTFQSGVDLLQVDVSVLDRDGRPIPDLGVSDFSVAVDGEPRRVVQAQFISFGLRGGDARPSGTAPTDLFSTSNTDAGPPAEEGRPEGGRGTHARPPHSCPVQRPRHRLGRQAVIPPRAAGPAVSWRQARRDDRGSGCRSDSRTSFLVARVWVADAARGESPGPTGGVRSPSR